MLCSTLLRRSGYITNPFLLIDGLPEGLCYFTALETVDQLNRRRKRLLLIHFVDLQNSGFHGHVIILILTWVKVSKLSS